MKIKSLRRRRDDPGLKAGACSLVNPDSLIAECFRLHLFTPSKWQVASIIEKWQALRDDSPVEFMFDPDLAFTPEGPLDDTCACAACGRPMRANTDWQCCYDCRRVAVVSACGKTMRATMEVAEESVKHGNWDDDAPKKDTSVYLDKIERRNDEVDGKKTVTITNNGSKVVLPFDPDFDR